MSVMQKELKMSVFHGRTSSFPSSVVQQWPCFEFTRTESKCLMYRITGFTWLIQFVIGENLVELDMDGFNFSTATISWTQEMENDGEKVLRAKCKKSCTFKTQKSKEKEKKKGSNWGREMKLACEKRINVRCMWKIGGVKWVGLGWRCAP